MTPLSIKRKKHGVMHLTRCINHKKNLSNLPDEQLIAILSCLDFHEAARTSILSHRWRYLWKYTTCSIGFYDEDTRQYEAAKKFINSVSQVLKLHQGESMRRFEVSFVYPYFKHAASSTPRQRELDSAIDGWINFAIGKQVNELELDMAAGQETTTQHVGRKYSIPHVQKLFSICGEVKLLRALTTLKSFQFVFISITQQVVEFLLAHCPLLEEACIIASPSLTSLKVDGILPNLRSMEISDCHLLKTMQVHAPGIVSFTYIGPDINVPFKKVPNLSDLFIGGDYADSFIFNAHEHSSYSRNLKKLRLEVSHELSMKCLLVPNDYPQLCSLKELELNITAAVGDSLCFFTFLAKCSPQLSRLTIQLRFVPGAQCSIDEYGRGAEPGLVELWRQQVEEARSADRDAQVATTFFHKCLEVVELGGFVGCSSDCSLALHLLRVAARSLKKMVLESDEEPSCRSHIDKKAMRECAKQLKANLPLGAELLTRGPGFTTELDSP